MYAEHNYTSGFVSEYSHYDSDGFQFNKHKTR